MFRTFNADRSGRMIDAKTCTVEGFEYANFTSLQTTSLDFTEPADELPTLQSSSGHPNLSEIVSKSVGHLTEMLAFISSHFHAII